MGCVGSKERPEHEQVHSQGKPAPRTPQPASPAHQHPSARLPSHASPDIAARRVGDHAGQGSEKPGVHNKPSEGVTVASHMASEIAQVTPQLLKLQAERARQQAVLREELQQRLMREINSDEEEVAFLRDVKLLQKVGQGASGAVYLGLWQGAQTVAVKLIVNTLDKELDLRTVKAAREAALGTALQHPGVVRTLAHYTFSIKSPATTTTHDAAPSTASTQVATYIVCEFCDGGTLADMLHGVKGAGQVQGAGAAGGNASTPAAVIQALTASGGDLDVASLPALPPPHLASSQPAAEEPLHQPVQQLVLKVSKNRAGGSSGGAHDAAGSEGDKSDEDSSSEDHSAEPLQRSRTSASRQRQRLNIQDSPTHPAAGGGSTHNSTFKLSSRVTSASGSGSSASGSGLGARALSHSSHTVPSQRSHVTSTLTGKGTSLPPTQEHVGEEVEEEGHEQASSSTEDDANPTVATDQVVLDAVQQEPEQQRQRLSDMLAMHRQQRLDVLSADMAHVISAHTAPAHMVLGNPQEPTSQLEQQQEQRDSAQAQLLGDLRSSADPPRVNSSGSLSSPLPTGPLPIRQPHPAAQHYPPHGVIITTAASASPPGTDRGLIVVSASNMTNMTGASHLGSSVLGSASSSLLPSRASLATPTGTSTPAGTQQQQQQSLRQHHKVLQQVLAGPSLSAGSEGSYAISGAGTSAAAGSVAGAGSSVAGAGSSMATAGASVAGGGDSSAAATAPGVTVATNTPEAAANAPGAGRANRKSAINPVSSTAASAGGSHAPISGRLTASQPLFQHHNNPGKAVLSGAILSGVPPQHRPGTGPSGTTTHPPVATPPSRAASVPFEQQQLHTSGTKGPHAVLPQLSAAHQTLTPSSRPTTNSSRPTTSASRPTTNTSSGSATMLPQGGPSLNMFAQLAGGFAPGTSPSKASHSQAFLSRPNTQGPAQLGGSLTVSRTGAFMSPADAADHVAAALLQAALAFGVQGQKTASGGQVNVSARLPQGLLGESGQLPNPQQQAQPQLNTDQQLPEDQQQQQQQQVDAAVQQQHPQHQRQQLQGLSILSTDRPSHMPPVRARTPTQLLMPLLSLSTALTQKDSVLSSTSPHANSNSNLLGPMSAAVSSPSGRGTHAGTPGAGFGLGSITGMGSRSSFGPAPVSVMSGGGSFQPATAAQQQHHQQQRQALHALITAAANSSLTVRELLAAAPQGLPSSLLSAAAAAATTPGGAPPGSLLHGPASRLTSRVLTAAPRSMTSSALVVGGAGATGAAPQQPPPQQLDPLSQQGSVAAGAGAQQQQQVEVQGSRPGTDGVGEVTVEQLSNAVTTLYEIAEALVYMHSLGVVHGDVKAANILLKKSDNARGYTAKLADFGVSRMMTEAQSHITVQGMRGTPAYIAPELVDLNKLAPACDVYAFGILMWEILTCRLPFEGMTYREMMEAKTLGHLDDVLVFPAGTPWSYENLARRCWSVSPDSRGPIKSVLMELDGIKMELQGHHSVGFSLDIVSCLPPGMEFLMDDELLMDLIQCMDANAINPSFDYNADGAGASMYDAQGWQPDYLIPYEEEGEVQDGTTESVGGVPSVWPQGSAASAALATGIIEPRIPAVAAGAISDWAAQQVDNTAGGHGIHPDEGFGAGEEEEHHQAVLRPWPQPSCSTATMAAVGSDASGAAAGSAGITGSPDAPVDQGAAGSGTHGADTASSAPPAPPAVPLQQQPLLQEQEEELPRLLSLNPADLVQLQQEEAVPIVVVSALHSNSSAWTHSGQSGMHVTPSGLNPAEPGAAGAPASQHGAQAYSHPHEPDSGPRDLDDVVEFVPHVPMQSDGGSSGAMDPTPLVTWWQVGQEVVPQLSSTLRGAGSTLLSTGSNGGAEAPPPGEQQPTEQQQHVGRPYPAPATVVQQRHSAPPPITATPSTSSVPPSQPGTGMGATSGMGWFGTSPLNSHMVIGPSGDSNASEPVRSSAFARASSRLTPPTPPAANTPGGSFTAGSSRGGVGVGGTGVGLAVPSPTGASTPITQAHVSTAAGAVAVAVALVQERLAERIRAHMHQTPADQITEEQSASLVTLLDSLAGASATLSTLAVVGAAAGGNTPGAQQHQQHPDTTTLSGPPVLETGPPHGPSVLALGSVSSHRTSRSVSPVSGKPSAAAVATRTAAVTVPGSIMTLQASTAPLHLRPATAGPDAAGQTSSAADTSSTQRGGSLPNPPTRTSAPGRESHAAGTAGTVAGTTGGSGSHNAALLALLAELGGQAGEPQRPSLPQAPSLVPPASSTSKAVPAPSSRTSGAPTFQRVSSGSSAAAAAAGQQVAASASGNTLPRQQPGSAGSTTGASLPLPVGTAGGASRAPWGSRVPPVVRSTRNLPAGASQEVLQQPVGPFAKQMTAPLLCVPEAGAPGGGSRGQLSGGADSNSNAGSASGRSSPTPYLGLGHTPHTGTAPRPLSSAGTADGTARWGSGTGGGGQYQGRYGGAGTAGRGAAVDVRGMLRDYVRTVSSDLLRAQLFATATSTTHTATAPTVTGASPSALTAGLAGMGVVHGHTSRHTSGHITPVVSHTSSFMTKVTPLVILEGGGSSVMTGSDQEGGHPPQGLSSGGVSSPAINAAGDLTAAAAAAGSLPPGTFSAPPAPRGTAEGAGIVLAMPAASSGPGAGPAASEVVAEGSSDVPAAGLGGGTAAVPLGGANSGTGTGSTLFSSNLPSPALPRYLPSGGYPAIEAILVSGSGGNTQALFSGSVPSSVGLAPGGGTTSSRDHHSPPMFPLHAATQEFGDGAEGNGIASSSTTVVGGFMVQAPSGVLSPRSFNSQLNSSGERRVTSTRDTLLLASTSAAVAAVAVAQQSINAVSAGISRITATDHSSHTSPLITLTGQRLGHSSASSSAHAGHGSALLVPHAWPGSTQAGQAGSGLAGATASGSSRAGSGDVASSSSASAAAAAGTRGSFGPMEAAAALAGGLASARRFGLHPAAHSNLGSTTTASSVHPGSGGRTTGGTGGSRGADTFSNRGSHSPRAGHAPAAVAGAAGLFSSGLQGSGTPPDPSQQLFLMSLPATVIPSPPAAMQQQQQQYRRSNLSGESATPVPGGGGVYGHAQNASKFGMQGGGTHKSS